MFYEKVEVYRQFKLEKKEKYEVNTEQSFEILRVYILAQKISVTSVLKESLAVQQIPMMQEIGIVTL